MEKKYNNMNLGQINERFKEEQKRCGPSELALSLRKKKIEQILSKNRIITDKITSEELFGNNDLRKLCDLSKLLYEEKNILKINEILDHLYFFLLNIKEPISTNYIDRSILIQHLYTKIIAFKDNEILISKSFDVFEEIIRITPSENSDKFYRIFNEQYIQILYELIDLYQNNRKIVEKLFTFLANLVVRSYKLKEYLMKNPGKYLIQTFFSLDTKYPLFFIKLMASFCNLPYIFFKEVKQFEIMIMEKCENIISLFYEENHTEPKNLINNSILFKNLFKCLSYMTQSINAEVINAFFINDKNEITLYEKILTFTKLNLENLSIEFLKITGNLFCSSNSNHIKNLIECKSYQLVFDILSQQYNNKEIVTLVTWGLSNFVNESDFREIFLKGNYINDLITVLQKFTSYQIILEILVVILNLLDSMEIPETFSLIGTKLVPCCIELLTNLKEPNLLMKVLAIVHLILIKSDPKLYLDEYYKNSDDKMINIFKFQFDYAGLDNILNDISINNKHENVRQTAKMILDHFYSNENKIITD